MKYSLRLHFLLLFACTAVLSGAAGYRFYAWYSGEVTTVLGQRFAERNVLYEKSRVLGMLTREVTLVQKMANAQSLRDWAEDETNPELKRHAMTELEEYRVFLRDRSYSFGHAATGNYYFNDGRGEHDPEKPRYVLDPAIHKDAWFFLTLRDVKDTQLNVDTDRTTRLTKVWINSVARNKAGKAVAVVSGGLDLSDFISSVVNSELPGAISILIDRHGAIQGHPDASMIDFASSRKAAGKEAQHTLVALLDNPNDGVALNKAMAVLVDGKSEVETLDLMVQGKRQLVGLTWLPQIQWFVVTLTSPANAVADTDLAWAAIWLAVALNLLLLVVMYILQRTVVSRVIRLDQAAKAISEGARRVELPADTSDDEIGHLTRTFKTMLDRIATHTEELEGLVAERTEKYERLAQTDFLTGVMNRRGMMVRLEAEQSRLLRTGGFMAVMVIDIDYFKRINDTCGHAIGDQALVAAARVIKDSVREYDLVARWGGEEFLVALFGLKEFDELQAVAEKLLAAIRKDSLDCGESHINLTYSIGGVMANPMANLDAIIHLADDALYRAKIAGRDRAVLDCLLLGESQCDRPICCGTGTGCPVTIKGPGS